MRSCLGCPLQLSFLSLGWPRDSRLVEASGWNNLELRGFFRSYETFNFHVSAVQVRNWSGNKAYCGVRY